MSRSQDAFDSFVEKHPTDWPERLDGARILLLEAGFVDSSSLQTDGDLKLACDALVALGVAHPDRRLLPGAHGTSAHVEGVAAVDEDRLRRFETRAGNPEAVRQNARE